MNLWYIPLRKQRATGLRGVMIEETYVSNMQRVISQALVENTNPGYVLASQMLLDSGV